MSAVLGTTTGRRALIRLSIDIVKSSDSNVPLFGDFVVRARGLINSISLLVTERLMRFVLSLGLIC